MPNLKFLAITVSEMKRLSKIPKVGHVTPSRATLPNFAFFVSAPGDQSAYQI